MAGRKIRHFAFILTMPNVNTWNNRWSGEGKIFAKIESTNSAKQIPVLESLSGKSFGYDFGDGWYARVEVNEVDGAEKRKLNSKSSGFMGYEWMIRSIKEKGFIQPTNHGGGC